MQLDQYVRELQQHLVVAAQAGGDEARAIAERLTAPLDTASRLVLLDALTAAAGEITRELSPGSVDVRLRGRDPEFVVTVAPEALDTAPGAGAAGLAPGGPGADPGADAGADPAADSAADSGGTSRTTLRLTDALKGRAEQAAARDGISVNSWFVRAIESALEPAARRPPGRSSPRLSAGGDRFAGWVR